MVLEIAQSLPGGDRVRQIDIFGYPAYPSLTASANWTWAIGSAELLEPEIMRQLFERVRPLYKQFYVARSRQCMTSSREP